jgi:hypothetical protein
VPEPKAKRTWFPIALIIAIGAPNAFAADQSNSSAGISNQENEELERAIIIGLGGATEIELRGGSLHAGINALVEYEAIPNWLELELGVSILRAEGGTEVPIDLLFKKPFRLARRLELMIGVGPQIVRVSGTERNGTFAGGELVFDLMFWPTRHFGLWLEPSYAFLLRGGVSHGLGATGGMLLGW